MPRVARAVAQTPGAVKRQPQHFAAPHPLRGDQGMARAVLHDRLQVLGRLPHISQNLFALAAFGQRYGQNLGALLRRHRQPPVKRRQRRPHLFIFRQAAGLHHHWVPLPGRREPQPVRRLRPLPVFRLRAHRERRERGQRRVRLEGMRHGPRPADQHQQRTAVDHAGADLFLHLRRQRLRVQIAQNNHVKRAPLVAPARPAARLGIAELASRRSRRQPGGCRAGHLVGMDQPGLEMYRFVAPEKKIAQVAEFPARRMIHQQHVDAVVADRHVGAPGVVVYKQLAVQRLGSHRITHNPVGRRLMRQPDLALPVVRRDRPLLLLDHVCLAQQ